MSAGRHPGWKRASQCESKEWTKYAQWPWLPSIVAGTDAEILLQTWVSPRDPPIARSTPWGGDPLRPTLHFCLMQGCGNPLAFNWWLAPESPPNIGCLKKQHGKHLVVRGLICMATHLVGGLLRQFPQKLFQSMGSTGPDPQLWHFLMF